MGRGALGVPLPPRGHRNTSQTRVQKPSLVVLYVRAMLTHTTIRWTLLGSLMAVLATGVTGCSSSDNNGFACASQAPQCPSDYACIAGACWRNGIAPGTDGGFNPVDGSGSSIDSGIDGTSPSSDTKPDLFTSVDTTLDVPLSPDVPLSIDVAVDTQTNPCVGRIDGSSCGTGKVCSAGVCQDGCWIASAFVASGGGNASNTCQICVPSTSTTNWSNNDAKTAVSCGTCGGTASCVGGNLGSCSIAAATYYPDSDGDGYGAATGPLTACTKPVGYVTDHTDCCDTDAKAHPGQTLTFATADNCSSYDYNCDGKETPKSNGPMSCGPSSCVRSSDGSTCVLSGCAGCDGSCKTWTVAECGKSYSTSSTACVGYSPGGGSGCTLAGTGNYSAGTQECN